MRGFGIFMLVVGIITMIFNILAGGIVAVVGLLMMMVGGGKAKEVVETATDTPKGLADKIKEIDDLKEQGMITPEEYDTRRKALLGSDT